MHLEFNSFVGDTSFQVWGLYPISSSSPSSLDVNLVGVLKLEYAAWLKLEGGAIKDTVLPDIGRASGSSNSSIRRMTAFLTRFVELVESPWYCPTLSMLVVESLGERLRKHSEDGLSDEYTCCEDVDRVRKDEESFFPLTRCSFLIPFNYIILNMLQCRVKLKKRIIVKLI